MFNLNFPAKLYMSKEQLLEMGGFYTYPRQTGKTTAIINCVYKLCKETHSSYQNYLIVVPSMFDYHNIYIKFEEKLYSNLNTNITTIHKNNMGTIYFNENTIKFMTSKDIMYKIKGQNFNRIFIDEHHYLNNDEFQYLVSLVNPFGVLLSAIGSLPPTK